MSTRRLAVVLMLSLTAVGLGATVFREQVAAAAPGVQDVFVTNSTREPVPVHEQGTADVNVTNAPLAVHEQGTANVNVTNAPLAVRESGEQPVQRALEWNFINNSTLSIVTYTVPAGKFLRIEQVTFEALLNGNDLREFTVGTTAGGAGATHYLPFTPQGVRSMVSELVTIYADPGATVDFTLRSVVPISPAIFPRGSFSGVLIDAP